MTKLIGISGKMGCGKTVFAGELQFLMPGWRRLSFADALKEEVSTLFGFPAAWCYSEEGKQKTVEVVHRGAPAPTMTVRTLLQWWGTDIRRKQFPDYWVRKTEARAASLVNHGIGVIIDDVRFPSEAEMVKKLGGVLIRLEPYAGYQPREGAEHESETALDDYAGWDIHSWPQFGELPRLAAGLGREILTWPGVAP